MLPYARQSVDAADVQAVVRALTSDWLTTGPAVPAFEAAFAALIGARFAVAVSNGTAALHAAAFAAGIGPGDEVIVPALTFAASANCVRYMGGTVVFADVRPDTLNLDPARLEAAITPRTRAVVTVDYTGQPSDLDEIRAIAARHNLTVIEDAAHSLGATYKGRRVGTLAHLTTFSFHPAKLITTGEGGMVATDDPELAARLRRFRNHGITTDHRERAAAGSWAYDMVDLGFNYRLTDFQCALGQSQLLKLPAWLARRREIAARYTAAFESISGVVPPTVLPDRDSAWHLYVIRLNLESLRTDRAGVYQALRAEHIGVNVHYMPVPWHPYYQRLDNERGQWPVAEAGYERMLTLPLFPAMTDQDVADVVEAVARVVRVYGR
jgi:UDP-4-amino-4,6-dideoxy-N-acetyl-beta-L-altrosamine transaminase